MEWLLPLICMIPAAVSDLKYRRTSLESCVAAILVGCAAFVWWALAAPLPDVVMSAVLAGTVTGIAWVASRMQLFGEGDWWFVGGACVAVSTLGLMEVMWMVVASMGSMIVCHVMMCVIRPGLPFPQRLYTHVKRKGDRFRVHPGTLELVEEKESGMRVRPALPLATFLVPAAITVGVLASL